MKKYTVLALLLSIFIIPSFVFAQAVDTDPNGPVSSCVSIVNNLRYKTRDASVNGEVSTLQDFLQSQNLLNSEPTGYFGILTLKAVKDFQKANDISPTGYVGPATRAKIALLTCVTISTRPPALPQVPQSYKLTITIPEAKSGYDQNFVNNGGLYYQVNRGQTYKVFYSRPEGITETYKVYVGDNFITETTNEKTYINWTVPIDLKNTSPTYIDFLRSNNNIAGQSPRITPTENATYLIGDVNGDGVINCIDATMISQYSVNLITLTSDQKSRADVNGDGIVNIIDAQQIARNNNLSCGTLTSAQIDAKIKTYMSTARAQAEIYWDTHKSYAGVCSDNNTGVYSLITNAAKQLSPDNTIGATWTSFVYSATGAGLSSVCHDSANGWAAITSLKQPTISNAGICVDSTGKSYEATSLTANTVACPQQIINTPTAWIHANDKDVTTINSGQTAQISWGSTNATDCYGNFTFTGSNGSTHLSSSGVITTPPLTQTTSYTISCGTGSINYSKVESAVVNVVNIPVSVAIGDINADGIINCVDVTMISQYTVGLVTLTTDQKLRADVNSDGVVNIIDAQQLARNNGLNCSTTTTTSPFVLISPNNGESFDSGSNIPINWTPGNPGLSKIELISADGHQFIGGGQISTIYSDSVYGYQVPNTSGSFSYPSSWAVAGSVYIKIYQYGTGVTDQSDKPITIGQTTTVGVAPTVNFSATPTSVSSGQLSTLSWSAINATSCYLDNINGQAGKTSATQVVYPTQTTTYTLNCYNAITGGGPVTTKTVTVNVAPVTTTTTLFAPTLSAQTGTQCDSVSLSWTPVAGATYYKILRDGYLITTVATSYVDSSLYTPLTPSSLHTYTVSATDGNRNSLNSNAVNVTSSASCSTTGTGTPAPSSDDSSSANYSATSSTPLSSTEKTVVYTYPYYPCGSLMTVYTSPGSVSVGNGPVYSSSLAQCTGGTIPDTSTFRTYSCRNNSVNGVIQGTATFAFQCKNSISANVLDAFNSIENIPLTTGLMPNSLSPKFKIGDKIKVKVIGNLNVRSDAGVNAKSLGGQRNGVVGVITDGLKVVNGQSWWKIDYAYAQDGWSTENYLELQK